MVAYNNTSLCGWSVVRSVGRPQFGRRYEIRWWLSATVVGEFHAHHTHTSRGVYNKYAFIWIIKIPNMLMDEWTGYLVGCDRFGCEQRMGIIRFVSVRRPFVCIFKLCSRMPSSHQNAGQHCRAGQTHQHHQRLRVLYHCARIHATYFALCVHSICPRPRRAHGDVGHDDRKHGTTYMQYE